MATLLTARQKRKILFALLSLAIALIVYGLEQAGILKPAINQLQKLQPGQYTVLSFADGDTIEVDMNGTHERIRFIGVDTPETQDPRVSVQCFGKAAGEYTKQLIGSNPVRLEADPDNTNRDRYDRLLRYVYLPDGRLVNAEIIKAGYGFAYILFPFSRSEEFQNYEQEAREQNRGLWGSCQIQEENDKKTTNPA